MKQGLVSVTFRSLSVKEIIKLAKDVYDECKFGWRERTQTCEECKLEYLNKKTEPKNIKEAVLDELF